VGPRRPLVGIALALTAASVALVACGGGAANDPAAREALLKISERSAAAKSYVAVVDPGKKQVTFTYVAPDRLRVEQGDGSQAVVIVQIALAGYHSKPGMPGHFAKHLENVSASDSAPLKTVSALIVRSAHVTRKDDTFRFDVSYGSATAHLLVEVDGAGRIASADLPVFDKQRKIVSYRQVTFGAYDRAPAVVAPPASVVTGG
jgi:tryptophanase